ncbi:MAG: hypothetical protein GXP28_10945 [Planctomycetes bacterium]|nr:hypothetical protein [Planctomycetota bacterium]
MRKPLLSIVAVVIVAAIGCAKPDAPADVVAEFLEAVRLGNSESASTKLTPLALQRIKENDMDFAPPASETAQFRVGKVEMFEADKAFVESVWIERDADGQSQDETMTWGLRLTDVGWRISGMAAHMGPDRPPILVDFENPGQLMGTSAPRTPGQGDGISRQARQPSQDPFQQTPTR